MFKKTKNRFLIPRDGADPYVIPKDYIGEIPEDVAWHWLIAAAIESGMIATPQGRKDKQLEIADEVAADKADKADIRPDAQENTAEVQEDEEPSGSEKEKYKEIEEGWYGDNQ